MAYSQRCSSSNFAVVHTARSGHPSLMYAIVHFTTDLFKLSGHALLDTGSNVGLIDVKLLPKTIVDQLTPSTMNVHGVGGVSNVLGQVTGTIRLGQKDFSNLTFQIVNQISDQVQLLIGTDIFMDPTVDKYEVDNNNGKITFSLNETIDGQTKARLVTSDFVTRSDKKAFKVTCHNGDKRSSLGDSESHASSNVNHTCDNLRDKLALLKSK